MEGIKDWITEQYLLLTMDLKATDILEIIILSCLIYYILLWVKRTRAWSLLKGIIVIILFYVVVNICEFDTIKMLLAEFTSVGILAIMIIFQPELRRALETLGENQMLSQWLPFEEKKKEEDRLTKESVDALVSAVFELGRNKTGALIVIEQTILLEDYVKTGIALDAVITKSLLIQIFEHNTPLHDGAVIIRGNRIVAATCYLPLSGNMAISKALGTRHRAGLGISEVSDSITIIASEETGKVSLAVGGELIRNIDRNSLQAKLNMMQKKSIDVKKFRLWKKRKEQYNGEKARQQQQSESSAVRQQGETSSPSHNQ